MNNIFALCCYTLLPLVFADPLCAQSPSSEYPTTIFQTDFESQKWWEEWGLSKQPNRVELASNKPLLTYTPHQGKALKIRVDKDGHYGLSLSYQFAKQIGKEPEEIYFRYYLRFGNDWKPQRGGKLPGIGGTYGKAGWGGRKVNGTDGWSARGLFGGMKDGKTPVGFYCYHADMPGKYGDNWYWNANGFDGLENNKWYCVEQHVKLNTPKKNDGVLRVWIDDQLVFAKSDVRMRDTESLKIENVWINVYYGGTWTAQQDYHLYIDDVAIGTSKIGK